MNRLISLKNLLPCSIEAGTLNGASQETMPQLTNAGNQKKFFMKVKCLMIIFILVSGISSFAQSGGEYEDNPRPTYKPDSGYYNNRSLHSFKKENIFLGGTLQVGYAANTFEVGGNPEIGYSISEWLDAGISLNLIYSSQSADPNYYYNNDTRTREFNYGGGIFLRAYPVRFLFFELQPEENWIHESQVYYGQGGGSVSGTFKSNSLIAGVGYGQRIIGQANFFTLIGIDVLNNPNSPYRQVNVDGSSSPIPIIRAGFDFYLNPSRRK
jgi:hypothetical protein